jgi:lipid-A-disaccharide synthase
VRRQKLDAEFLQQQTDPARPLVTILPGSRTQEIVHNLDHQLRTAKLIAAAVPQVRFALACFKPQQAEMARQRIAASGLAIDVFVRRTPELIRLADCCLAVSGSVSLELLYQVKPTVIVYTISPLGFRLQSWFRRVRYITLVNLLATDDIFFGASQTAGAKTAADEPPLFPEFVTCTDKSAEMARQIVAWLVHRDERARLVARLDALKGQVAHGGASGRAATYILAELDRRPKQAPRPHYQPSQQLPRSVVDASHRKAA